MPKYYPSRESISRHCHLIRILTCPDLSLLQCLAPGCTNLLELELAIITGGIAALIQRNANSLKSLKRLASVHQPGRNIGENVKLFTVISSLTKLQHLWMEKIDISINEGHAFLKTCKRLVSLQLNGFAWKLPELSLHEFPMIQQLNFIKNKMSAMDELEFVAQCPNVRFFRWQPMNPLLQDQALHAQILLNSRLKYLRTLAIQYAALRDADIAAIVTSLPALVNLHAKCSQFGEATTQAIVSSKKGLQELDICDCEGTTSEMIQAILSSCQDLETFGGNVFDMRDLATSSWACKRLRTLHISIMSTSMDAKDRSMEHTRMYDQIAQLRELRVLELGDVARMTRNSYDWIDLTISSGLWRLKALEKLEYVTIGGMHQPLGEEEVEWMNKNMPNVEFL
ncbi:hypothetical protein BGZ49_010857 [Haplosporangium sp. Z 27]|nr:hypothetical protein BGZ49_010857 [Haplosporangium sp. Z 27]